jgi:signal transduction histidine kinase
MTRRRTLAIVLAAIVCGAGVVALVFASDHLETKPVWAIFGPAVGWSFIGTGLYAARRRPESRVGTLMVLFGFAWFGAVVGSSDNAALYSLGLITGGLWGAVFLQLVMTFPSGRIQSATDRGLVIAGYVIFTVAVVPAMFFAGPSEFSCDECPTNILLVDRNETLAKVALGFNALLYVVLFVIVLIRLARRWWRTPTLERLQLTPVYASGILAFLLVTVGTAGAGDAALWPAFAATALLPAAFLAGLLRSHVARLDAELRARMEELRASRVRIVEAGDSERRRLERNLHDGAQARLVGLAYLLGHARRSADKDPTELPELLDQALDELKLSLSELRDLARGIHPAVLTERGLDAAVYALASRAPIPVDLETRGNGRLPEQVEIAAYFTVAEALTNVAKYAQATEANVAISRENGRVTVDVTDDGVGGADRSRGSGLRGLADRVAALDGTLDVDSPPGQGTHVRVEIPLRA